MVFWAHTHPNKPHRAGESPDDETNLANTSASFGLVVNPFTNRLYFYGAGMGVQNFNVNLSEVWKSAR